MKTKSKSKVIKITIARLYNLGNYEHVRYEITADVPPEGKAQQTFMDLTAIIARLKPIKVSYEHEHAKALLNKPIEALTESEKEELENARKIVGDLEATRAFRRDAIKMLDDLGGTSERTNRKDCQEDDTPF